ncbi:MAG: secretion activator protein [Nitrospirae bacterium]|nr:secretion activator protein [Nitrospirota bacterium]
MNFDKAFEMLIDHEKGFSKDPNDPGNWTGGVPYRGELKGTKYGIAANTYPDLDIENLTLDLAKEIYRRDFWGKLHLDELPENVRFDLFDAAVNSGVRRAAKFLQAAARVVQDGDIGPATIAAANAMNPEQLDSALSGHRILFMADLQTLPHYARGWMRRIGNNLIND